jgi:uncharacterized protein (DUF1684 family)
MRARHRSAIAIAMLVPVSSGCTVDRNAESSVGAAGTLDTMKTTDHSRAMSNAGASHERAAWHAERLEGLRGADGWLTLVGLDFLESGTFTAGRDERVELCYAGCAADRIGRFEVDGEVGDEVVRFVPEAGAAVSIERGVAGEPLIADDAGPPSMVRSGTVSFTLVRRNDRLALRVRDSASPTRTGFEGLGLFPFDPGMVVEATVRPAAAEARIPIANVTGHIEQQRLAATLVFELDGVAAELQAMPAGNDGLFVVFADGTNGRETYGGGRFLLVPPPRDGRTTIDFNRAYFPPCAFTAFATCPMPPASNRLSRRVEAGERWPAEK